MTADRIRGRRLQRIRMDYFRTHPLCEHCQARQIVRAATELDHRVALINGGKDFDADPSQRQALCGECHGAKTLADLGLREPAPGDATGMPIDPSHPWNVERDPASGGARTNSNPF